MIKTIKKQIKGAGLRYCNMQVDVKVLGEKTLFGKKYYLITPVAGKGKDWVSGAALKTKK